MAPALLIPLITAVGPSIVAGIKSLFKTNEAKLVAEAMGDLEAANQIKMVHKALPLAVGLVAGILNCLAMCSGVGCFHAEPVLQCIMAGLAGGAGASYIRDLDKNILGIAESALKLISRGK